MTLDEKLRHLKQASKPRVRDEQLEQTLEYLRRLEQPPKKKLPSERVSKGIEEYVEGQIEKNAWGECFLAHQALPFGRPYGKLRIGDLSTADLSPLNLFLESGGLPEPAEILYLDTETTGLAGGTGTCAFLIGIGSALGKQFSVEQFFIRDYPEEKAMLALLAQKLASYSAVATFNGKTFDIPLLETRYALARMKSPFARMVHLDLLHPARRLWKLRLESCKLTNLEGEILGISREGDVEGSEIPGIYFDYLRTGDASGLQPVFYHNALDVVTLAALTVEMAQIIADSGRETLTSSIDLFSLSRIFDRAGVRERSVSTCERALARGLPQQVQSHALWHLASQYKRQRRHELAVEIWTELAARHETVAINALEELAIYYEHRQRNAVRALEFTTSAVEMLRAGSWPSSHFDRFARRLRRLEKKAARTEDSKRLPID